MFGIDPAAFGPTERDVQKLYVWPDMLDSIAIFFAMATQWRWVGAGMSGAFRVGLEYGGIRPTAENIGITMTPQIFEDIRILEGAALETWNRKR